MKKIVVLLALTVGLWISVSTMAQNMNRYITLTVAHGAAIKLDFKADSAGTAVRIKSGNRDTTVTVGTDWYNGNIPSTFAFAADGNTMTVYGNLSALSCMINGANLTAIDPSHNTELAVLNLFYNQLTSLDLSHNTKLTGLNCSYNQLLTLDISHNTRLTTLDCSSNLLSSLEVDSNRLLAELNCSYNRLHSLNISHNTQLGKLVCYGNSFTREVFDDIFCSLPDRRGIEAGTIEPLYDVASSEFATVIATNKSNATNKNWKVRFSRNDTDIPATAGGYICGGKSINMNRYIRLKVKSGEAIKLDFKAAATATPIKIASGSSEHIVEIGTDWYDGNTPSNFAITAADSIMTIYGDVSDFSCGSNGSVLTTVDPSHNMELAMLNLFYNQLSSLDLSRNTQLVGLNCSYNHLKAIDLSHNTQLRWLNCSFNEFDSLRVDSNKQLTWLNCSYNRLTALDLEHNSELMNLYCFFNKIDALDVGANSSLTELDCSSNRLSSLSVGSNRRLTSLVCYGNAFSRQALDNLYCSLPDRNGIDVGFIQPAKNALAADLATVVATNAQNAISKNWKVQYFDRKTDIATTGNYACITTDIPSSPALREPFILYPNPASDMLYLSATARTIRVYNIYGIEVAHATDTDRVDVAHLPAGVYTVKADSTVAKMVKR